MDFKITKAADIALLRGTSLLHKWKGEVMPDEKQTCFGCQHSLNLGAPNIDSPICMDMCRRGSEFKPFNGDAEAIALKKEGKEVDAMVEQSDELSLNPKTQGNTNCKVGKMMAPLPAGSYIEVDEGTVFRGIQRRPEPDHPIMENARALEGMPGQMVACEICQQKKLAETIIEQDMKRAMMTVDPIILPIDADHPQSPHNMVDEFEAKAQEDDGTLRSFDSGATRDTGGNKLVYDKFLSPDVIKQFAKFMNMNRLQSDGKLRAGDNWQKGIPMDVYEESEGRHHHETWEFFRQINLRDRDGMVEGIGAMCGILFNVMAGCMSGLRLTR